jgi:hypothetical protein
MLPVILLNTTVDIKRRSSTGRDSLNNPTYGVPTSGTGWNTVFQNISVRLAFSSKAVNFANEGERVQPQGVMYYNAGPDIHPEDRVLTETGIEYNVISVVPGYVFGKVVDHWEAVLQLP